MDNERRISRRRFLVGMTAALGGSALLHSRFPGAMPSVAAVDPGLEPRAYLPYVAKKPRFDPPSNPGRIVHIRNAAATSWTGETDYWNYLDQPAVDSMVDQGLLELTGATSVVEAWQELIPDYQTGQKIAIKVNFNNTRLCGSTVAVIDALMEPVNAVAKGLIAMGVAPADICVYDAIRALPDRFIGRDLYGVSFFDGWWEGVCRTEAGFSELAETQVQFYPPVGVVMPEEHVTNALMNATYLINMPIMKGSHPYAGVTLGFKNHFGSISTCSELHDYVNVRYAPPAYRTDYNPLVDLLGSSLIGGKTVLTVGDGLFAARHFARAPVPWSTFDGQLPNSLFFATDPVAVDCLMHDLLIAEPDTSVPAGSNNYLRLAAEAGLGVFEAGDPWQEPFGSGYGSLGYTRIDM